MYQIVYIKYNVEGNVSYILFERNNAPKEELETLLLNEKYKPFYKTSISKEPECFNNFKLNVEAWIMPNNKTLRMWNGQTIRKNVIHDVWEE